MDHFGSNSLCSFCMRVLTPCRPLTVSAARHCPIENIVYIIQCAADWRHGAGRLCPCHDRLGRPGVCAWQAQASLHGAGTLRTLCSAPRVHHSLWRRALCGVRRPGAGRAHCARVRRRAQQPPRAPRVHNPRPRHASAGPPRLRRDTWRCHSACCIRKGRLVAAARVVSSCNAATIAIAAAAAVAAAGSDPTASAASTCEPSRAASKRAVAATQPCTATLATAAACATAKAAAASARRNGRRLAHGCRCVASKAKAQHARVGGCDGGSSAACASHSSCSCACVSGQ